MATDEPDDLDKIAQLAVKRGYWDARQALEGAGQARAHTGGPQKLFLRRLLERTCGLTYDELARLEKDALAVPLFQTPSKPLPRLGSGKPASTVNEALASPEVVIPRPAESSAPPPPQPQAATYTPPPREEQIISSAKKLPKLGEQKEANAPPPAEDRGSTMTPRALPRLNAPKKKPEEPSADAPAPDAPTP